MIINDSNYVEKAEKVIRQLNEKAGIGRNGKQNPIVSTSQLRNILAMSADIYNMAILNSGDQLSEEIKGKLEYLKIRIVYDAGREAKVKDLVKIANILEILSEINGSKKNFILFNHYLEAIVAYRKFLGTKESN